eukprot:4879515-Amphidinium_carterae.2
MDSSLRLGVGAGYAECPLTQIQPMLHPGSLWSRSPSGLRVCVSLSFFPCREPWGLARVECACPL